MANGNGDGSIGPYRFADFTFEFVANVMTTSQTVAIGRQLQPELPRRPGKPLAGIHGEHLRAVAHENMLKVATLVWNTARSELLDIRRFISKVIHRVHGGMPNAKMLRRLRTHETLYDFGCPASQVEKLYGKFINYLERRLNRGDYNPIRLAAEVEWEMRFKIHPLADGSGRVATALVALIMLRSGLHLPHYRFREGFHHAMRWGFESFYQYYLIEFCQEAARATWQRQTPAPEPAK